jgi:hypothetical protein
VCGVAGIASAARRRRSGLVRAGGGLWRREGEARARDVGRARGGCGEAAEEFGTLSTRWSTVSRQASK